MKRQFRLTRSTDFKRVRTNGKSFAHPLVVLYTLPSEGTSIRVGVSTSRAVGNAVKRNRAKRLLREACASLVERIRPGLDLLLVARNPLPASTYAETLQALTTLFERAGTLLPNHGD